MKNNPGKMAILFSMLIAVMLIFSACRNAERPPFLPSVSPVPPPEMRWDVQADFDILTPFVPQYSLHTRLHEGALPELIPSKDYGLLLPYSSSIILGDGSLREIKFGFGTIDGIVVTDLIYDHILRAESMYYMHSHGFMEFFPAYQLRINVPETESSLGFSHFKYAACALDGSWITAFDYSNVVFTEDVILLIRGYEEFDIDIIDYSGNHLYNTLETDWINEIQFDPQGHGGYDGSTSTTGFIFTISQGYGYVYLQNGTIAFIDIQTGKAYYTEFVDAQPFMNGFAAVADTSRLWGLVDINFEIKILPRYNWIYSISKEKFIAQPYYSQNLRYPPQLVLNTQGDVLLTVPEGYHLGFSGELFFLTNANENSPHTVLLSSELEEIRHLERIRSFPLYYLNYLGNGWHTTSSEGISLLINESEEHYFSDVWDISFTDGELIIYLINRAEENTFISGQGVKTMDGNVIIHPESGVQLSPVIHNDKTVAFTSNTGFRWIFHSSNYTPTKYKLYAPDGEIKIHGSGILTYHESLELYSIQSANHFSWLDKNANLIIAIPLLSSTID